MDTAEKPKRWDNNPNQEYIDLVKMKGEELGEKTNEEGSFSAASPQDRLLIAFAGPLFNILFALAIYVFVYLVGVPVLGTVVGHVKESSPASVAGLQTGDQITAINGKPIQFFIELQDHDIPSLNEVNQVLLDYGSRYGLQFIATNDVHYVKREDAQLHDVLLCVQTNALLNDKKRFSEISY